MTKLLPKCIALCASLALLSGCVEATSPASAPPTLEPGATSAVFTGTAKAVPFARALQLFDAVCIATAPNRFAGATAVMAANDVKVPSPMGTATLYSVEENLSFQIEGSGQDRRCSMVFGTNSSESTVVKAFVDRFGTKGMAEDGLAAVLDQKSGYLVIFEPTAPILGQRGIHLVAYDKRVN
ncbi:hypothetical protein [Stagnihabitans tardus]|uniref:Lipoprotein n=1 Tax=Stagnihabitans tardus TaxID=2699202 RepID=A0AAE4YAB7_9RHOB|nr:hypothetical protein [Stagnihabitans tardus]NBZ87638.1 hypothetical protein [Stagnihabitans tardus]